ncbi:MAG: class I SAM-dependent methyltransferase [Blastocatellia bacterium]|nr:MAG: class I SAM-dependent methyltransferase [Blastocatellia bacterium]
MKSGAEAPHSNNNDPVCEFYTDHPYPPPVENLDRARDEWQDLKRHRADYHLFWPDKPYRSNLDILVAGCGTWQAAKYAACRPNARVLGIDFSKTSLDHSEQLKRKYKLTNLELRELPIERVTALDRHFDLIICTGVLHHLSDPDQGLKALGSVLKPDGVAYLMVYAPYGRTGVYMMQQYCRRLGIGTSRQELSDLMTLVKTLSSHHPLTSLLRGARDAANPDALADALLNPRDRAYAVPEFLDLLDRNDLKLARWSLQAPYLPHCGSISTTTHGKRLTCLSRSEQFAAMELFRGTMTCHSAIVGRASIRLPIPFEDDHWTDYVPIRLPNTLCVLERLPPGAAGVLLNQTHQFHDLILVINLQEKRMFDAIDGNRSVGQIVKEFGTDAELARDFFQKLWWFDQVVFDMSQHQGPTR